MYLCDRADKEGRCFPSVPTIAAELKMSERTVYRGLNELEKRGFIKREPRWRMNGGRSSSIYVL